MHIVQTETGLMISGCNELIRIVYLPMLSIHVLGLRPKDKKYEAPFAKILVGNYESLYEIRK